MSVECSMLAIGAERYEALRRNPRAVTDEVILRGALSHLAGMAFFKQNMAEAEVLAEIRAGRRRLCRLSRLWSPERFAAAAAARRPSDLAVRYSEQLPPGVSLAELDAQFFLPFKTFILDAAASRNGMLIRMS